MIKDDVVWAKAQCAEAYDEVFINLNYVDFIYHIKGIFAKAAVLLIIGDAQYQVCNVAPTETVKSDADILADYVREGRRRIVLFGDCVWITCSDSLLVNINHIDRILYQSEHNDVHYDVELDEYDPAFNLVLINSNTAFKTFGLEILEEMAFREYLNLPKKGFPANFIWPHASLKRFDLKEADESKWKLPVGEFTNVVGEHDINGFKPVTLDELIENNARFKKQILGG